MGVPQATVVRKGGQHFTPPPVPRDHDEPPSVLGQHLRDAVAVALGLWPLTGVVLLAVGLLFMAGMNGAP